MGYRMTRIQMKKLNGRREIEWLRSINADLLELARLFERVAEYEIHVKRKDGDEEGAQMTTITLNMIRTAIAKATRGAE